MKRSRLQQMSLEVMVGAFMMMALLALGFFTIILSQDNVFRKTYTVHVVFDYVTGLVKGDKVYVHGVNVGRVKNLGIRADGVHADLALDYDVKLREDYHISVVPSSGSLPARLSRNRCNSGGSAFISSSMSRSASWRSIAARSAPNTASTMRFST